MSTNGAHSDGESVSEGEQPKRPHPVEAVQEALNAEILVYNGPIFRDNFNDLLEFTRRPRRRPNGLFLLSTSGGDPDAAYRIGRCLQQRYEKLTIFIPGICKSAGTLVALAAHELVLSDSGELGPLDIQMRKRDEILEVGSGLDTTKSIDFLMEKSLASFRRYMLDVCMGARISTKTAADIATNLTVGLFGKLYEQIDPIRLAETMRATTIASFYGNRLSKNLQDDALHRLVHAYPAHSYVIDLEEAKALFRNVRGPTEAEESMLAAIPDGDFLLPHEESASIFEVNPPSEDGTNAEAI